MKFTYVAAPVAIVIWLLWSKRYSQAAWLCSFAAVVSALFLAIFLVRGDPIFSQFLIMRHLQVSSRSGWLGLITQQLANDTTKLVLLFCLIALIPSSLPNTRVRPEIRLIALYFALCWIIALLTCSNSGADLNYFLAPQSAGMLLIPFGAMNLMQAWPRTPIVIRRFVLLTVVFACALLPLSWFHVLSQLKVNASGAQALLPALAKSHTLSDSSYLTAVGKEPELLDPYLSAQLEISGKWSSEPILDSLSKERYDLVIIRLEQGSMPDFHGQPHFSPKVTRGIDENYQPFCKSRVLLVMVPLRRTLSPDLQQGVSTGCEQMGGLRLPPS